MQTQEALLEPKDHVPGEIKKEPGWRQMVEPWRKAFLAILPIFLITRAIFLFLTYFGVILFTVPNYSHQALSLGTLVKSWYRWDADWYAAIASQGYVNPAFAAFFPLYPLLERIVGLALLRNVFLAGMLISNLAFLGTLIVLYRFVETEFDSDTARRTTLYLAIFPTAFFFFAAYNESLFLFFVLLSFYAMRRSSWWLAGLFGGLAALTRSMGSLILLVFLYEFTRQVLPQVQSKWHERHYYRNLTLLTGLPASLLIPIGLAVYAYYLDLRFHDPLALIHAQVHWRIGPTVPWYAPGVALKSMSTISPFTFTTAHNIIDLTAMVLFLTLLVLCFVGPERFAFSQWSMLVFGLVALLYPLFYPGIPDATGIYYDVLPSTQRFVLEIFPCFILLGRFGRRPWFHQAYLLLSLPLLAFFVLQFITGHWTV